VTSKAVLEKCRAEGLELKNHMAALSAGLAATIQEWFSEQESTTAVEVAEHVDLARERRKATAQRRRRQREEAKAAELAAAEAPEAAGEAPVETLVAVAELPAESAVAEAPAEAAPTEAPAPAAVAAGAPEQVPVAEAPAPVEQAAPEAPVEVAASAAADTAGIAEAPAAGAKAPAVEQAPPAGRGAPSAPTAVPNVPERPKVVGPAGPQVVPQPVKLQGPRVVRFEGIEVGEGARRPASSSAGRSASTLPIGAPGRAPKGTEEGEGRKKRAKRRSPRRKGGRGGEGVGEGLREWRDRDLLERSERLAAASGGSLRRHRASVGRQQGGAQPAAPGAVEIDEPITVKTFSAATGIRLNDIIKKLMGQGVLATINSGLDRQMAEALARDAGLDLNVKLSKSAEQVMEEEFAHREGGQRVSRAPVVTFLGHVDHGKTSLLDRIRNARVAAGEEGGITQHVGSYRYDVGDAHVVFLDTPGHEAFTAMRARGANMTDVAVLVVAADDGVMPQTVEAISHAKAANVPIIVALNKIDLPNANIQRALGQLAEHGLQPREWGGQTEVIHTSAQTGEGVAQLAEHLTLEAEMLELKADPAQPATGWVVESRLDTSVGALANLLVMDGTLKVGDVVLAGRSHGRVRSLLDDRGRPMDEAGPATPVLVAGLDDVPDAGDRFHVVENFSRAREVAQERRQAHRAKALSVATPAVRLEDLFAEIEAGRQPEVRLVVKADVQGSIEALLSSIAKQATDEVKVDVLHSGVGGITEADVLLAEASQAIVMGFRVVPDNRARALAEKQGVEIRLYTVIYQLVEDLAQAVKGMLKPEVAEEVTGRMEVRQVFRISRIGTVAGCYVTEGVIARNNLIRIIRDNVVLEQQRQIDSLRREKDDVREVRAGLECGLKVAGFDDIKVGDVFEAFQMVEVPV